MSDAVVRQARPSDWPALAELRATVFGGTPDVNHRYLDWKYRRNPFVDDPLMEVALHLNRPVGMRGWFTTPWHMPGQQSPELLASAAEMSIHPEHRNRGLYPALDTASVERAAAAGYPFVASASATPANYVESVMRLQWRRVGAYGSVIRAGAPAAAPSRSTQLARRVARRAARIRGGGGLLWRPMRSELGDATWWSHPDPGQLADIAAGNLERPNVLSPVRNEMYYRWRLANPLKLYAAITLGDPGNGGFVVLQTGTGSSMNLVDWAGPDDVMAELVGVMTRVLNRVPMRTWTATLREPLAAALAEHGFSEDVEERRRGLLVKPAAEALEEQAVPVTDMASWGLRPIISDRY